MFWRAQRSRSPPRPRSPPRLTSTIPEMEQHLATMNTPLSQSPVDKADNSATALEDLPAASPSFPDPASTTAASSDEKAVPDKTEVHPTSSQDDNPTSSAYKVTQMSRLGRTRAKAQHVRPRLLTLIACVSLLLFHVMGMDIGLRIVQEYTEPRLNHAKAELDELSGLLAAEYTLNVRMNSLLDTAMSRPYQATTYEECLVRGLHTANGFYHSLDFTADALVRNETAEWVTSNCRRLHYTPQVHNSAASMFQAQVGNARHAIKESYELLRYRFGLLKRLFLEGNLRLAAKPAVMPSVNDTDEWHRILPDIPYGFGLECGDQTHCRLIYLGSAATTKHRETLLDAIARARKEVNKWSWEPRKLERIVSCMFTPLAILQPLLMLTYLLALMITSPHPQYTESNLPFAARRTLAWKRVCYIAAHLRHDERQTIGYIINTALYALLRLQLKYLIADFDRVLLPVGLGFWAFHASLLALFIDRPRAGLADPTLGTACKAIKELYLLVCSDSDISDSMSQHLCTNRMCRKKRAASQAVKPASKIGSRFISPLTTVSEDIQQERKAMHAEQGEAPRDDVDSLYGYATETDKEDESEVERSTYVDLTGGTPVVSEGEEDMVLVEDQNGDEAN